MFRRGKKDSFKSLIVNSDVDSVDNFANAICTTPSFCMGDNEHVEYTRDPPGFKALRAELKYKKYLACKNKKYVRK